MAKLFETIGKLGLALAFGGGIVNSALFNGGCLLFFYWNKNPAGSCWQKLISWWHRNCSQPLCQAFGFFFYIFNVINNYFKSLLQLYIRDCVHLWYCCPDYNISEWFSCCLSNSWCRTPGCYIWPVPRSSGSCCWWRNPFPHSLGAKTHHLRLSISPTQRSCHHRQQRYINYCWFDACAFNLIYY